MLQDKKTELAGFITDADLPAYLDNLAKSGTYGDHICLEQLSKILECRFRVIHGDGRDVLIGDTDLEDLVVIGFIAEMEHYTSLEHFLRYD